MYNFRKIFISFFGLFLAGLPLICISSNGAGIGDEGIQNPLAAESFTELFIGIAEWAAGIAVVVAVLMIVIGGFQYMISGGNEEKIKTAIKTIKYALIGLMIALLSWSLLSALLGILGIQ